MRYVFIYAQSNIDIANDAHKSGYTLSIVCRIISTGNNNTTMWFCMSIYYYFSVVKSKAVFDDGTFGLGYT